MKKQTQSPAMTLVLHVRENWGHRRGRSRQQSNEAVSQAVKLAIRYGLEWAKDDFAQLAKQRTQSYYDTSIYRADEFDYSLACGSDRCSGNPTAAASYEAYRKRKPFLICDDGNKTPTRVYVGRRIEWAGDRLEVTSFSEDGNHFIAVKHENEHAGGRQEKPRVGEIDYFMGDYRKIVSVSEDGFSVTYSPEAIKDGNRAKVVKRIKLSHEDIREQRRRDDLARQLKSEVSAKDESEIAKFREWFVAKYPHGDHRRLTCDELREAMEMLNNKLVAA